MPCSSHLSIVAAAACLWLLWRLLDSEDPADLKGAEWVFPLRGRWLRYLLATVVSALLLLCLASLFVPAGTAAI